MTLNDQVIKDLLARSRPEKVPILQSFFKTGPGHYAEGDVMLGISVPDQRLVAKKYYSQVELSQIQELLQAAEHEFRLTALFMLVYKYQKTKDAELKRSIYEFYLANKARVNNWDLVDASARYIVGDYLYKNGGSREILYQLTESETLWDRRIAVLATFYFIAKGEFKDTLKLCELLLQDKQDLMHKACGWMLREVGNRDLPVLLDFLDLHYKIMPRTMLRYAIEKLEPSLKAKYMKTVKPNQ